MAFFGSADSDSLVKQLRSQLAQKDFEIQTLINEQTKKDELWSETKRAKDDALYKASSRPRTISSVVILIVSFCCTFPQAQTEQERAMKAERTLAKSTAVCLIVFPSRYSCHHANRCSTGPAKRQHAVSEPGVDPERCKCSAQEGPEGYRSFTIRQVRNL